MFDEIIHVGGIYWIVKTFDEFLMKIADL